MAKTFRAVEVSTLSNNGQSTPKYNKPVTLNINYDPQGLSVELVSGTDAASGGIRGRGGRFLGFDGPHRSSATRLIDHAIAAHPGDITTLTASRRLLFFLAPLLGEIAPSRFAAAVDRRPTSLSVWVIGKRVAGRNAKDAPNSCLGLFFFFSLSFFFFSFIFHRLKHSNEKLQ